MTCDNRALLLTIMALKRKRSALEYDDSGSVSTLTPISSPVKSEAEDTSNFQRLPASVLLVSIPKLLVQPPNHAHHAQSLCLSLLALRRCLSLPDLSPEIECRAWTALAEIGMCVIAGGFSQNEEHPWARSIEQEVKAGVLSRNTRLI